MTSRTVQVTIDNRVRLMSAVLSATSWPDIEQRQHRHRAHVHARVTARRVADLAGHPAARTLQALLDAGTSLERLYTYALNLSWPDLRLAGEFAWAPAGWNDDLRDFCVQAGLVAWWAEEDALWQRAAEQMARVLPAADLRAFFEPFVGPVRQALAVMPNISFPSDTEIGVRLPGTLVCIMPPRIAWGDNEPWPFDDDPATIFRGLVAAYGRLLVRAYLREHAAELAPAARVPLPVDPAFAAQVPSWHEQFIRLFVMGAAAIFLEAAINRQEAEAYILVESKVHGATMLPGVVSVLRQYLAGYGEGRYAGLSEFLPGFAQQLRAAKDMMAR